MKRKLILLACLCITGIASAQKVKGIGIGIPLPHPSAALHVDSDDQGILIPNVVLTDLTKKDPITTEIQESLLVYNKQEKKEGTPEKVVIAKGYYYWIATTPTTGRWVRVLTSQDSAEILAGQIQESFVEETVNDGTGIVGTGVFVYNPDKTKVNESDANAPGRLKLDIPALVKKNQTLTTLGVSQFKLYHYSDKSSYRVKLTPEEESQKGIFFLRDSTEIELVYTDEHGAINKFAVRDLLGADKEDVLAITNLVVNTSKDGLTYTNDKGIEIQVPLEEVVARLETRTKMELTSNGDLIYYDEKKVPSTFALRTIIKEPWYVAETGQEAQSNKENMFVEGWVGVGLKAADAATAINSLKPDEKLRVNGSIYARNSYYADYVFENYFTKEASALKYDYNFKDLATVESFIKSNYHLPGITPIAELEKSKENGYLINVSELSVQLLEKVEELYLHTIDQQKIIDQQKATLDQQEARLQQIEAVLKIGK